MMEIFDFLRRIFFYASYLGGAGSFPKPLSAAEEMECVARWAAGDADAKDRLIEHNLRLVVHIAKKYSGSAADREDYISIGTIGLIKGVNTFSPEKNIRLATYVSRCIENEILMYLRKTSRRTGEVSFGDAVGEDRDGNTISLLDIIGTDACEIENSVETAMETERMKREMASVLSPRELLVISMRYGLGNEEPLPQREVAEKLGISRSYVSRLEKKALLKLRGALDKK